MRGGKDMRRSGFKIMMGLIGLIKPLAGFMTLAIVLGVLGFLCAIGVSVLGVFGLGSIMGFLQTNLKTVFIIIAAFAILRGILHYGEQACNHYIAFKLLAIIRRQIFDALRKLAPAKMEGKKKGELIAILTSDIELLEVFYAHTVSPIAIAVLTSLIMIAIVLQYHIIFGVIAFLGYLTVGCVLPIMFGKRGAKHGVEYRQKFSDLNSNLFDSLRGVDEILQYDYSEKQYEKVISAQEKLNRSAEKLRKIEGFQRGVTGSAILVFGMITLIVGLALYDGLRINFDGVMVPTVMMLSSFGPVVALSNLSNNLNQTLACGERVLNILEEEPAVTDVVGEAESQFGDVKIEDVDFSYEQIQVLSNISMNMDKGKVTGILGKSGSGKSTLLKLLMRFWQVDRGRISIGDKSVNHINTSQLRDMQGYVTQETWIFNNTIGKNIEIAKIGSTAEEVKEAARKAGIAEFIEKLPKGYDTTVGELGDSLSGGERQRIGIARAFLQNSEMILLDEPTSNLDSLNENYILKSLNMESGRKTIILVSHRESTMAIADRVHKIQGGRLS